MCDYTHEVIVSDAEALGVHVKQQTNDNHHNINTNNKGGIRKIRINNLLKSYCMVNTHRQ